MWKVRPHALHLAKGYTLPYVSSPDHNRVTVTWRWGDVPLDRYGVILIVSGNTGVRHMRIVGDALRSFTHCTQLG